MLAFQSNRNDSHILSEEDTSINGSVPSTGQYHRLVSTICVSEWIVAFVEFIESC